MTDLPNFLFILMRRGRTVDIASKVLREFPDAEITGKDDSMTIVADGVAISIVWGHRIEVIDQLGKTLYLYDDRLDRSTVNLSLFGWHTTLFRTLAKAVGVDLDTVEGFA